MAGGPKHVDDREQPKPPRRQYPPLYERLVPVVLGFIVIAVLVILVIIILVVVGLFPGSG